MRTIYRYILCTILTSLALSQQLDIERLEQLVIDGNHQLAAGLKQIESKAGLLEQSRKLPNPVMNFESGSGSDPETMGMLSQTIPLVGKRKHNINLSDLKSKKAELEFDILKQTKLSEAFTAFSRILYLQKIKTFQKDRIAVSGDLLNAVTRKVEAGKLSPAEKSRARIQLYQEQLKLRSIEKSLETSWTSLAAYWGEEKAAFNYAEGDLSLIPDIPVYNSFDNAPEILLSNLRIEIQKANVQSEKADAIPDIKLGAGLKQSDIPGNTFQVGVSIPFPIFNRNQGNIKSAESEFKQSQLELRAIEFQLRTRVSNLQAELRTLASEIAILEEDIIPEAQDAYTIISDGYLNGRFTYLDVVDSQKMWFQSREQYVNALKDYHTNFYELDRITGITNHTNFKEIN